jgi:hypothetical protein
MGWEIYPDGLRDFLLRVAREYSGDLPIYVTENGMANPDTTTAPIAERIAYLEQPSAAVQEAIAQGAPVAGYFVWSLMDNYEWALGYEKRFGLVHVDFETLARTPKASYQALARWWRDDATPPDTESPTMTAPARAVAGCRYRRHEHPRGAGPWRRRSTPPASSATATPNMTASHR